MTARWNFKYSPSERKTINATTFYKVTIGKETKWLSMSGIKMLNNAREAGVNQKTALKAAKYYTGQGTRVRIAKMRRRIAADLAELMELDPKKFEGLRKGLGTMANLSGNYKIYQEMQELLSLMTEDELQQFYRENQMLLAKYFTDSDKLKGTPATAAETDVKGTERNIARNAEKLLGKIREILARRLQ